jgi:diguanylate cyclase (GGDEF)-like protein
MNMGIDSNHSPQGLFSTERAGRRETRLARVFLVLSVLVFLAALPFAQTPLTQVPAFIPMYVSSLVICDLITAALLFGQFSVLRWPALLVLAGGYLFSACATVAYTLIFPGLFAPTGLFDAGPQTSSAMYMFWHSGFPVAVITYALFKAKANGSTAQDGRKPVSPHVAIAATVGGVLALVVAFTLFATWGHAYLPSFLDGNSTTGIGRVFLFGVWLLSLVALVAVWTRKPHTVLDVWMLVVMCVWLLDIALAALLNSGRYDLGWYVGRIYGLLAAGGLLMALLIEDVRQYTRLFQLSVKLTDANQVLDRLSRHDGLTGLPNRRFFDEYLAEQMAVASRYVRPLALVICDADHFKDFNDHYGHLKGDECLRQIARALQSSCTRPADMVARYGGEEFALILPDTDLTGAIRITEQARAAVASLKIPHARSSAAAYVSISCGISDLVLNMNAAQFIAAADGYLYQAKKQGRNRVVSASADH